MTENPEQSSELDFDLQSEIDLEIAKAKRDRDIALNAIEKLVGIDPEFEAEPQLQRIDREYHARVEESKNSAKVKFIEKHREADLKSIKQNAKLTGISEEQTSENINRINLRYNNQIDQIFPISREISTEKQNEYPSAFEFSDSDKNERKSRHWFVTSYLFFGIFTNSCFSVYYFYSKHVPVSQEWLLDATTSLDRLKFVPFIFGSIAAIDAFLFFTLLRWKAMGYYIFAFTTFIIFLIKITLLRNSFSFSITTAILSVLILYLILHIKKNGVSAWDQLGL